MRSSEIGIVSATEPEIKRVHKTTLSEVGSPEVTPNEKQPQYSERESS